MPEVAEETILRKSRFTPDRPRGITVKGKCVQIIVSAEKKKKLSKSLYLAPEKLTIQKGNVYVNK